MITAGVAVLSIALIAVLVWRGTPVAFLRLCWVPLALLVLAWLLQRRLGYAVILLLVTALIASVGLVGFGLVETVRATRRGLGTGRSLILATAIAGSPLVWMALWALVNRYRNSP